MSSCCARRHDNKNIRRSIDRRSPVRVLFYCRPRSSDVRSLCFLSRTGECCKANEMVDDTAVPSVSGVKKDVSTAILERKKSPNRLVVGKSLILPANPDLIGMTFRGDFQRSKGPWLLFLGTQLDVRRRTRFAISTFHPTDENLFPLPYLLSKSYR